jgi:triacylglycerol lipase
MRKDLPASTYDNLFYPPAGYRYFENAANFSFHPQATGFDPVNAWWLADAAVLAYEKEAATVTHWLQQAGLSNFQPFGNWQPIGWEPRAFVASTRTFAVISFRGTQRRHLSDLIADVTAKPVPENGFEVHEGFKNYLDKIWDELNSYLQQIQKSNPGMVFYFTGHSLGAALATLAISRFKGDAALYNIGSPRVGDSAFQHHLATRLNTRGLFRFVNCGDEVTHLPPELGVYAHVGTEEYIDRNGAISDRFTDEMKEADAREGKKLYKFRATIPPFIFRDHSPGRYPILIWNYYLADKAPATTPR